MVKGVTWQHPPMPVGGRHTANVGRGPGPVVLAAMKGLIWLFVVRLILFVVTGIFEWLRRRA
jgi:hypothetical protein